MQGQISIFDGTKPFKIDKPIRLIELFAGYGSQALALKYLGVDFEHWRICEWAVKSIQAYKDLHFGEDNTDYSVQLSAAEVYDDLLKAGISSDYETPMTAAQVRRLGEKRARRIYNNIKATRNLVSVTTANADDFDITETDKYCYIMTYSYPCQDISNAGLYKGMKKGSGTRSSLIWEVERILKGLKELPQVLLMENVPGVLSERNIEQFAEWISVLDSLGYKTKWQKLNATDFNVPQNRERLFALSVLGDFFFDFPTAKGLNKRLLDVLEPKVNERYYLKGEIVLKLIDHKKRQEARGNGYGWNPLKISGGGGTPELSERKAGGGTVQTLPLKNKATEIVKSTETASALLADSKANVDFVQGLDARFITEEIALALTKIKIKMIHFAFDFMKDEKRIVKGLKIFKEISGFSDNKLIVYMLTNFDTTIEEDLYRLKIIQECGYLPDVRIYRKPTAPQILKDLQRWCNNRFIYRSCSFMDYVPRSDGKTIKELYFSDKNKTRSF